MLKKYYPDPTHILQLEEIEIDESLTYEEKPVQLLDRKVKELRNKQIPLVKILWKNHGVEEATWEVEEEMQKKYPDLFTNHGKKFRGRNFFKGERVWEPEIFFFSSHYFIYLHTFSIFSLLWKIFK